MDTYVLEFMGKKKRRGRVQADRKPIGTCAQCGELAYKRRPKRVEVEPGEYAQFMVPLCYKHYQRLRRYGTLEPGNRSLTAEDVRWCRARHREGMSGREIWRMLKAVRGVDVSYDTVWRRLKEDYKSNTDYESGG